MSDLEFFLLMGSWLKTPKPWSLWNFLKKIKDLTFKSKWVRCKWYCVEPRAKTKTKIKWNPKILCTNFLYFFWHLGFEPFGGYSHVATYRSSSEHTWKTNIQSNLNKIHCGLICSWNLMCLVLLRSLWNM